MKFQPGQSGNPNGRPLGSLNKKTLALHAAFEDKAEGAVNDVMERAKSGDPAAMRLFMDRAVPVGRHRRFAFALPRIRTPEDAEAAIDVVMDGLAEGVLSLADVAELLRIVERLLQLAETIQEIKRVRDSIARRPAVEPDEDAVQQAFAGVLAAARELSGRKEVEDEVGDADALYFPVNSADAELVDAVDGPSGPQATADSPPAPATAGDAAPPPAVAA